MDFELSVGLQEDMLEFEAGSKMCTIIMVLQTPCNAELLLYCCDCTHSPSINAPLAKHQVNETALGLYNGNACTARSPSSCTSGNSEQLNYDSRNNKQGHGFVYLKVLLRKSLVVHPPISAVMQHTVHDCAALTCKQTAS